VNRLNRVGKFTGIAMGIIFAIALWLALTGW